MSYGDLNGGKDLGSVGFSPLADLRRSGGIVRRPAEPWVFPPQRLPNFYRSKFTRTQLAVFIIFSA
jgi:hypothetical protein